MIAAAMEYPSDQNASGLLTVINDVVLNRKAAYFRCDIFAKTARSGITGEKFESLDDFVDQTVGCCKAYVLSDVLPDLVKVRFSQRREPIAAHRASVFFGCVRRFLPRDFMALARAQVERLALPRRLPTNY